MKVIDYSKIANKYDCAPMRQKRMDLILKNFITSAKANNLYIGDVGCGTGTWIAVNKKLYFNTIKWTGVDASQDMLDQAASKTEGVEWLCTKADEELIKDNFFDYINCEHAYHHFPDKMTEFANIQRMLKPNGKFVLRNHDPFQSTYNLMDYFFPSVRELNLKRFLKTERIKELLEKVGFVEVEVFENKEICEKNQKLEDYLNSVIKKRTISDLWLISDDEYSYGIEKLEDIEKKEPKILRELYSKEVSVQLEISTLA